MTHIDTLFRKGLSWGALESLLTQGLLTLHTLCLFRVMPLDIYGLVGTLFSVCYLMVSCATLGLDSALGSTRGAMRCCAKRSLYHQSILTVSILGIGLGCASIFYYSFITDHMMISLIIMGIILCETAKKTAKAHLVLLGDFKHSTLVDLFLVTSYVIMVWSIYLFDYPLSALSLCAPLLITALCSAISMCGALFLRFPRDTCLHASPINQSIYARVYALVSHSSSILFSGNVLVPLIARHMGFEYAGVIKLISNFIHTIIVLLEKMFGLTSTVLFAHTSDKQYVFHLVARYLIPIICIFSLVGGYGIYFFLSIKQMAHIVPYMIAYGCIHVMNMVSLIYERLLLDRQRGFIVLSYASLASLISFSIWHFFSGTYAHILIYIALSRLLYGIGLAVYVYQSWRISSGVHPSLPLCASALLLLLVYFYC